MIEVGLADKSNFNLKKKLAFTRMRRASISVKIYQCVIWLLSTVEIYAEKKKREVSGRIIKKSALIGCLHE